MTLSFRHPQRRRDPPHHIVNQPTDARGQIAWERRFDFLFSREIACVHLNKLHRPIRKCPPLNISAVPDLDGGMAIVTAKTFNQIIYRCLVAFDDLEKSRSVEDE